MEDNQYSLYIFDEDGRSIRPYLLIGLNEVMASTMQLITSPLAVTGMFHRIIITDGGDSTIFEWQYGKGIVYPPSIEINLTDRPDGVSGGAAED